MGAGGAGEGGGSFASIIAVVLSALCAIVVGKNKKNLKPRIEGQGKNTAIPDNSICSNMFKKDHQLVLHVFSTNSTKRHPDKHMNKAKQPPAFHKIAGRHVCRKVRKARVVVKKRWKRRQKDDTYTYEWEFTAVASYIFVIMFALGTGIDSRCVFLCNLIALCIGIFNIVINRVCVIEDCAIGSKIPRKFARACKHKGTDAKANGSELSEPERSRRRTPWRSMPAGTSIHMFVPTFVVVGSSAPKNRHHRRRSTTASRTGSWPR